MSFLLASSVTPRATPEVVLAARGMRGLERFSEAALVVVEAEPPQQTTAFAPAPFDREFEAQVLEGVFLAHASPSHGFLLFTRALAAIPGASQGTAVAAQVDAWA